MNANDRLRIAAAYRPVFIQGFEHDYDRILPIHLGEFIPTLAPVAYFSVSESAERYYCLYCIFHWKDWSNAGNIVQRRLDTHRFDFEGARIIVDKKSGFIQWVITVFHRELKFYRTSCRIVNVESQGHGTYMDPRKPPARVNLRYDNYLLEDIDDPVRQEWMLTTLQALFNPKVDLPWQWNHWLIRRRKGKTTDGLIYSDPERLLQLAREVGIIDEDMIEATITRVKGSEI